MVLRVLQPSRRRVCPGDVFAMLPADGRFLFGRVISVDANPLGVGRGILIYVYRVRAALKHPVPELRRNELLIPPMITNRLPWSRGYFETVERRALLIEDALTQHCFRDLRGLYRDELGVSLPGPVEPVGEWGLESYRTIDDAIAQALGLPIEDGAD